MRAPIPAVFGAFPFKRTATRAPLPSLRYTPASSFKLFITTSMSPSLSKSPRHMPCEMSGVLKPHAAPTSSNVKSPRLR